MERTAGTIGGCSLAWCTRCLIERRGKSVFMNETAQSAVATMLALAAILGGRTLRTRLSTRCSVGVTNAVICICVLWVTMGFAAAPAVYPRRVINNHQVDLLPLFVWWEHQEHQQGVRPLTSWKHIQGMLEQETIYGW